MLGSNRIESIGVTSFTSDSKIAQDKEFKMKNVIQEGEGQRIQKMWYKKKRDRNDRSKGAKMKKMEVNKEGSRVKEAS